MNKALQKLHEQNRFAELFYYYRRRWQEQGWLYLKRNAKAVKRIKQEFTRLTGKPPYQSDSAKTDWDQHIARWLDQLGVAKLIEDMRAACEQYQPYSIVYFLHSKTGACRWEMLWLDTVQQQLAAEKQQDNEAMQALASAIRYDEQQQEPEWVIEARKKYNFLNALENIDSSVAQQMAAIKSRLENMGYEL